jgi:CBS domain-containing protein
MTATTGSEHGSSEEGRTLAKTPHAVGALMTRGVVSVHADDNLALCAQIMWEHRCGAVPVVDHAGRPIAMVTDRDVAMATYLQDRPLSEIVVSSAMSRALHSVYVGQSIWSAEGIMRRHTVRRLPVVDDHRRLIGVVSIDDIARHIAATLPCLRVSSP